RIDTELAELLGFKVTEWINLRVSKIDERLRKYIRVQARSLGCFCEIIRADEITTCQEQSLHRGKLGGWPFWRSLLFRSHVTDWRGTAPACKCEVEDDKCNNGVVRAAHTRFHPGV